METAVSTELSSRRAEATREPQDGTSAEPGSESAARPAPESAPEAGPEHGAGPGPVRLSRWSRAVLGLAAALVALVTGLQLAAMLLAASPPNTLSQQYRVQLNWWITPWLGQNWKLFGPDPQDTNLTLLARVRETDGAQSGWVDLTAMDYAAVRHDPMPSHANENELRLAWDAYEKSAPGGAQQAMLRQYLVNFVIERLSPSIPGTYTAVQLEARNTPMPLPGTTAVPSSNEQDLPWWTLTDQKGSL